MTAAGPQLQQSSPGPRSPRRLREERQRAVPRLLGPSLNRGEAPAARSSGSGPAVLRRLAVSAAPGTPQGPGPSQAPDPFTS